jgi:hypothetical protein
MVELKIRELDDLGRRYQGEKRYLEAAECIDNALNLKIQAFGEFSESTEASRQELSEI